MLAIEHQPTLWLPCSLYPSFCAEANRSWPNETGGVLLGYRDIDSNSVAIVKTVGPGPNAVHEKNQFIPDHNYQVEEIARLYAESARRLEYLGDWHTHPGGSGYLSDKDRSTLKRIASERAARASNPVMLILSQGDPWVPSAWQGGIARRLLLRTYLPIATENLPYYSTDDAKFL